MTGVAGRVRRLREESDEPATLQSGEVNPDLNRAWQQLAVFQAAWSGAVFGAPRLPTPLRQAFFRQDPRRSSPVTYSAGEANLGVKRFSGHDGL